MDIMKETPTEPETRKTLPFGVGTTSGIKVEIEPLVKGKFDFKSVMENPVLKPISNINKTYENLEVIINKALWDYQEDKKQIDEMIKINPKYSETIILSKFQSILSHVSQIIHAQDIEKDNMKEAINEMLKIVEEEYGVLNEEEFNKGHAEPAEKPKKESREEINPEPLKEEHEEKPEVFHSSLLDKDIPLPDIQQETEEDIPKLNI